MKNNITGLVLAGGNARRMGGVDKGLLKVKNKYLISHVLDRMNSQVGFLMINANRNIDIYQTLSDHVVQDKTRERLGPLAGIQAGLINCKTQFMIAVPCDVPMLPLDICEKLYLRLVEQNADCVMPVTLGETGDKRTHPAILLLKTSLINSINIFLASGGRKIDQWTGKLNCIEVLFKNNSQFVNINSPEDIDSF